MRISSKKRKAQGVLEYVLVFMVSAIAMYAFASYFDLSKLKAFAVHAFKTENEEQRLTIPAMTD